MFLWTVLSPAPTTRTESSEPPQVRDVIVVRTQGAPAAQPARA